MPLRATIILILLLLTFGTSLCRGAEPVILFSSAISDTGRASTSKSYYNAVLRAGGVPIIAPVTDDTKALQRMVAMAQGIIMIGGGDIAPSYFNELPHPQLGKINDLQDRYDVALVRLAQAAEIPILAICRGEQILNVVAGGTLYQDIPSQIGSSVNHRQKTPKREGAHTIKIDSTSHLSQIMGGATSLYVNSFHHQSVKEVGRGLRAVAWSSDGVIEALESLDGRVICVQFHPEGHTDNPNSEMIKLFEYIVTKASNKR